MELAQLESFCERLYKSQDPSERHHAEQALHAFSVNTEYIAQCRFILENSSSPYAQLLASSSLVKQVSEKTLSTQLRLEIRNYIIGYLATKGPKTESYVCASLIQLLCRLTKFGWFDNDAFREITKDAVNFLNQPTVEHYYIGLKVLNQLVLEMNQVNPVRTLTYHRKTACSFRDTALFDIFKISLSSLQALLTKFDDKLRDQALSLALKCLSFDFVGTSLDESSEDLGTIQVPSSWKSILEQSTTLQLFFDYYNRTNPPLSNQALECLVRLVSVRRSLFSGEAERIKFLSQIMSGTKDILFTQKGLSEIENYHEFCKLLGRLKTNYQLSELVSVEHYAEWIRLVAEFTIKSLQSWQWTSGSVYYLLGLWSRLVSSMPYLKGESPSLLENYVSKITEAYISSRLESVTVVLQNNLPDDPLDNDEQLQDQLDTLPYLCRFQYDKTNEYILSLLGPILRAYEDSALRANPLTASEKRTLQIMESQLTWLVHIIGSIIKGRLSSSVDSQETIDGDLSARIFQLIKVTDSGAHAHRYDERSKQRLDLAILSFFQNFRKVYVGDQAMHSSKPVYNRLSELLGLQDHLMVLNVIVTKIATNLKCFTKCEQVIEETLNLFQELASGYMSGKLLLKLDSVNFILNNHTRENFPFLDEYDSSRNRTIFYSTLGKLLFTEDTPSKFKAFVLPLQQVFLSLESASDPEFQSPPVKFALIGLMRDLRGITIATNSRRTYGLLFDWIYPSHFPLILRAIKHWTDTPEVTTPLLKFMSEFVVNKTQRLTFDSSSPNGILLFREVSKIIVAYGTNILSLPVKGDIYACRYKGIWIALTILTRALAGNYVNFGVFELYGDPALSDALDMALKMCLSIPIADIMAFRKLGKAYFALLEALCHNHTNIIINLPSSTFSLIVRSLDTGLKSLDVSISSQCAAAVDNLAAYYFNNITLGENPTSATSIHMISHVRENPTLFPEILRTLFEIVLFEDCANQWSLSRPMLSLILINEQVFVEIKTQLLANQPLDQQSRLTLCFDKLMADVTRTLDPKNRDRFTQNLTIFRHDFRSK